MKPIKIIAFIFLFFCICSTSSAAIQQYQYWTDAGIKGNVNPNKKLLYDLNFRGKFDAQKNKYAQSRFIGGVGYQYFPSLSLWIGYQWDSNHRIMGTKQQYRIWQQFLWQSINNKVIDLSWRTRFEQIKRTAQSQWSAKLRERGELKFLKIAGNHLIPVIYDEIFVNSNHPSWVNNQLVDQNRVFAGFDIPASKNSHLQIGYLNQYRWAAPENILTHILLISFYFKT